MNNQDLIKAKPKKNYQWYQDNNFIYIVIQAKNTSIKKIQIEMSDLFFRSYFKQSKKIIAIDLYDLIIQDSNQNHVKYVNNLLNVILSYKVTIKKKQNKQWPTVNCQLPKQDLMKRRMQSLKRKQQKLQELNKKKQDMKWEYDRKATQQMMRLQDEQRTILAKKKEQQRRIEQQRVFGSTKKEQLKNVKQLKTVDLQKTQKVKQHDEQMEKYLKRVEQLDKEFEQEQIKQKKARNIQKNKKHPQLINKNNIIQFDNIQQDIQFQNIPIRQGGKKQLKFTQKIYPHLAARQQHYINPPMPKTNKLNKLIDQQNNNPLWLKDKGDKFYKDKDYISAIQSYNQAINNDNKFIYAFTNRCAANLSIFNYEQVLKDCNKILELVQGIQTNQQNAQIIRKTKYRKGICLAWKGQLSNSLLIFNQLKKQLENHQNKQLQNKIEKIIEKINKRNESLKLKQVADIDLKNGNYLMALQKYLESLKIDQTNQVSKSNITLCYLKLQQFKKCIEISKNIISYIHQFVKPQNIAYGSSSYLKNSLHLLLKTYLRKAKGQFMIKKLAQAKQSINNTLIIDKQDKEALALQKDIQKQLSIIRLQQLKKEAQSFFKNNQIQQCIQKYNQCLKIIDATNVFQYISILANRTSCFLLLQRYDDVIVTSIRGLKIIRNHKLRLVSFDNTKINKEDTQKLADLQIRFLLRRGKAYQSIGQKYNFISDIKQASQIKTNNENIKKQIQKLMNFILQ